MKSRIVQITTILALPGKGQGNTPNAIVKFDTVHRLN